jgi:hypothetical protein
MEETVWWGDFSLGKGEMGRWSVGPTTLWIRRTGNEWQIHQEQDSDPLRPVGEAQCPLAAGEGPPDDLADDPAARFSFRRTEEGLHVGPMLADRPVVARPFEPLYVSGDEEVTLFLSTPIWIRVESLHPRTHLCEVPTLRMSDTWFGPSTLEGELCYAIRTRASGRVEDMPRRSSRAITPVSIRSRSSEPVLVERIRVPLASLCLYAADASTLWSQGVRFELDESGTRIRFEVEAGPPALAGSTTKLAEARNPAAGITAVRAIGHFFHRFSEKAEHGSILDRLG